MSTVPIFSPDGKLGDIPFEQLSAALAAGAKPGITMKSPDGSIGVVPADRMPDAVKAGASIVPLKDQETQHAGFWKTLGDDLVSMASNAPKSVASMVAAASPITIPEDILHAAGLSTPADTAQAITEHMKGRKEAGYSLPYRALAPVGEMLGADVPGMEQSAAQGDPGAVIGHAAAVPTAMAATEGIAHGAPALASAAESVAPYAKPVLKAVGKTVDVATFERASKIWKAWKEVPEEIKAQVAKNAPVFHGAPFPQGTPEQINPSLVSPVRTVPGQIPPETIAPIPTAAANIPPRTGLSLPSAPIGAELAELPATGARPAAQTGEALANLPPRAVHQAIQELGMKATIPEITQRAQTIAAAEYPPAHPDIAVQKVKPSSADILDDKAVAEKIRNAASAEDKMRLREIYGQNRLGSDVSTQKGRLTGVMGEGNDIYVRDRSADATPSGTALPKEIRTPADAMRQVQLMKDAGASIEAVKDFQRRASVKFGPDWQLHSSDDLTPEWQKALDDLKAKKSRPIAGTD